MKKSFCLLASSVCLLSACGSQSSQSQSFQKQLENPLFAERYYKDMVDGLTEIEIQEPETVGKLESLITPAKNSAMTKAEEAVRKEHGGTMGRFVSVKANPQGLALLMGSTLFLSTDFVTVPSPNLHLLLTTLVDPRGVPFPDPTVIDVGLMQSPYGAQSYAVPVKDEDLKLYRTVVLYDTQLKRMYGFAQLAK